MNNKNPLLKTALPLLLTMMVHAAQSFWCLRTQFFGNRPWLDAVANRDGACGGRPARRCCGALFTIDDTISNARLG
ncbi:hypothetical protein [uncultured Bartonella sp.]|uniref:hypothetical protein n=1 Tax=uncultured Bartonella sp. TaxID=104108 RepID=UPI002603AD71|nr:hypothetical protein [uncultured Bartonella sp.]